MGDTARIAAYYDAQAARYDATLDREPTIARVRDAFRALVAARVPKGSRLLDFGCGTGLDAAWYAANGYSVLAYDPSPGMMGRLRERCGREIESGVIVPATFPFERFPAALSIEQRIDAIVANFGVLDLVPDIRDVFARFAGVIAPGGVALFNVLNPFYWRDIPRGWWWRAMWNSRGTGALYVDGRDAATYRHYARTITRAAKPAFAPTFRSGAPWDQFTFLAFGRTS